MLKFESKAISRYIISISVKNKDTGIQYASRLKVFDTYFSKSNHFSLDEYLLDRTFKIDVYELLSGFASYLVNEYTSPDGFKISNTTIKSMVDTARNFLEYNDVEINQRKYSLKVNYPKVIRQNKEALTKETILTIIKACISYKLRTFVHVLSATGVRASEACSIRLGDIDFNNSKINLRGEFTKTKTDRYVFITNELKGQLTEYLKYKYRKRVYYNTPGEPPVVFTPKPKDTDLIFASYFRDGDKEQSLSPMYNNLLNQFRRTLELVRMVSYENSLNKRRRKITFHSFRRFVKSVISDLGFSDYSEWFIGHSGSTYYRRSDKDKFELFKKIEPYLTFLDLTSLERKGADQQSRIEYLEQENYGLRSEFGKVYDAYNETINDRQQKDDALATLSDRVMKLMAEVRELKKNRK
jgi:integrase